MKVKITKQPKSSLTEDVIEEIELANLTIFAGENNGGKTNLVKAIGDKLENSAHIIYIPAERVLLDAEIKVGAEKDPFRTSLSELLGVSFDPARISSLIDDIEERLPIEFSQYNIEKTNIKVKTSKPEKDEYIKAIKDVYVKKIIDSISIQDGFCGVDEIKSSDVGQGTERLIIVSLLKYIGEKKKEKIGIIDKPTYLIIEEPEIYLHPKLKESFYQTLLKFAFDESFNIKVIITTHDPFFIELGNDLKIYRVFRDPLHNYSTQVEKIENNSYLRYKSPAEVNYQVFGLATPTYFLELYETFKTTWSNNCGKNKVSFKDFDNILHETLKIPQDKMNDEPTPQPITFVTRLRHDLAHPSTTASIHSFNVSGKEAIIKLREYHDLPRT